MRGRSQSENVQTKFGEGNNFVKRSSSCGAETAVQYVVRSLTDAQATLAQFTQDYVSCYCLRRFSCCIHSVIYFGFFSRHGGMINRVSVFTATIRFDCSTNACTRKFNEYVNTLYLSVFYLLLPLSSSTL